MTPLEARIVLARNHQLVARHVYHDAAMEAAATKLLDVALDHWARQAALHAAFSDTTPRGSGYLN